LLRLMSAAGAGGGARAGMGAIRVDMGLIFVCTLRRSTARELNARTLHRHVRAAPPALLRPLRGRWRAAR
jgi:hypothetical protein